LHRYSNSTRADLLPPEKGQPSPACIVHETREVVVETDARPTAKLQFADKSQGTWRLMLYVSFEKTIPENGRGPELADEPIFHLS